MPNDKLLRPKNNIKHTDDPVEFAKRVLDDRNVSYTGHYLTMDDCYVISIIQKRPISNEVFTFIRGLGFSSTGKTKFFYKRYSIILASRQEQQPIYGNGNFDSQPLAPAPDPFYNTFSGS